MYPWAIIAWPGFLSMLSGVMVLSMLSGVMVFSMVSGLMVFSMFSGVMVFSMVVSGVMAGWFSPWVLEHPLSMVASSTAEVMVTVIIFFIP